MADNGPAPGPFSFKAGEQTMITLKIGPDEVEFNIHKAVLCHHSPYFRAALTKGFKEAHEGVVKLPEVEVLVMEQVMTWFYNKSLPELRSCQCNRTYDCFAGQCYSDVSESHLLIAKIFVFAESHEVPELRHQIVDLFHTEFQSGPGLTSKATWLLFEKLPESSPMRKLVVDLKAFRFDLDSYHFGQYTGDDYELELEFLKRIIVRMAEIRPTQAIPARNDYLEPIREG